jgi:O-antigen/teichoic acid export membrane protein
MTRYARAFSEDHVIGDEGQSTAELARTEGLDHERPMAGGVVMSGVSRALVAATGAATTIIVAHVLGPAGFGAYAIAQTLIIVLMVATTLGVEHGIVYYVSSRRWSPASAFRSSQRLAVACGVVGAAVAFVFRSLVPGAFHGLSPGDTLLVGAALPFALSWFYASYVSLATGDYERYVLPPAMQSVLAMGLASVLAAADGITGAVLGLAAAHVLTSITWLPVTWRRLPAGPQSREREAGRLSQAVRFGLKGYAANALQVVNYRLDLFILNAVAASAVVGQYAVAVMLTSIMWLLPQALSDVLFPRVAKLSSQAGDEPPDKLRVAEVKGLRHTVLVVVAATVVLAVALLVLVVPIFGPRFHRSIGLGLILLPGVALLAIANPIGAIIVGRGRPGLMLTVGVVVTPLTVLMYLLLIPLLRAPGAALASSLSYAATFSLSALYYRRLTGTNPLTFMLPTVSELGDYRALVRRARRPPPR